MPISRNGTSSLPLESKLTLAALSIEWGGDDVLGFLRLGDKKPAYSLELLGILSVGMRKTTTLLETNGRGVCFVVEKGIQTACILGPSPPWNMKEGESKVPECLQLGAVSLSLYSSLVLNLLLSFLFQ